MTAGVHQKKKKERKLSPLLSYIFFFNSETKQTNCSDFAFDFQNRLFSINVSQSFFFFFFGNDVFVFCIKLNAYV